MSVDLTLADTGGIFFWLEAKLADNGDVGKTLAAANKDLTRHRKAAAAPQDWKLDDRLSGQTMVAPSGFGTLVCSAEQLLLLVDDRAVAIARAPNISLKSGPKRRHFCRRFTDTLFGVW